MLGILYGIGAIFFLLVAIWLFIALLKVLGYSVFMESRIFQIRSDLSNEEKDKFVGNAIISLFVTIGLTCYFTYQYYISDILSSIEGILLFISSISIEDILLFVFAPIMLIGAIRFGSDLAKKI